MISTQPQKTLERILLAAGTLFIQKSYADVTTAAIAAEAGLTKGALYHHFASKQELYRALLHDYLDHKRLLFQEAINTVAPARERLRRLTDAYLRLPRNERDFMGLVRRDVNVLPTTERAALVKAYQSALPEQVASVLSDAMAAGEIQETDPRLLSWHYVALVEVCLSEYADQLFPTPALRTEHVLNLFFHGAAAGPEALNP